jgi:hypothetical protein
MRGDARDVEWHAVPGEALMSLFIRTLVALMVLIPCWFAYQPRSTAELFVFALIAFGCGRIVAVLGTPPPSDGER